MPDTCHGIVRLPLFAAALAALVCGTGSLSAAQAAPANDETAVREADRSFWDAFNRCDKIAMARSFTGDAEFYHDKTGLTQSRDGVVKSLIEGPCKDRAVTSVRREAVDRTARFDSLAGGFALLSGEHRFYASANGGPERHDSIARYVEVWQRLADGWQMRRVVSYAHRPDLPSLVPVSVAPAALDRLVGEYRTPDGTVLAVEQAGSALRVRSGDARFDLIPIGAGRFGVADRWLEFSFSDENVRVFEEGREVASGVRTPGLE